MTDERRQAHDERRQRRARTLLRAGHRQVKRNDSSAVGDTISNLRDEGFKAEGKRLARTARDRWSARASRDLAHGHPERASERADEAVSLAQDGKVGTAAARRLARRAEAAYDRQLEQELAQETGGGGGGGGGGIDIPGVPFF